jgi:hypothetical protein
MSSSFFKAFILWNEVTLEVSREFVTSFSPTRDPFPLQSLMVRAAPDWVISLLTAHQCTYYPTYLSTYLTTGPILYTIGKQGETQHQLQLGFIHN